MISQQMPRLPLGVRFGMGETLEAFALTYLAHYNALVPGDRMTTSYTRAWAFDQITMSPRVPGGKPAYVVAYWRGDGAWKVVVAIEGATSRSQIAGITNALAVVNPAGCQGYVLKDFNDRATEMVTSLNADATFQAALARHNTQFTFAGFSLGAAVAEILAFRFKAANPSKIFKLKKFASPRVGTGSWVRSRDPAVDIVNILCNNDPIADFPQCGVYYGPLIVGGLITPSSPVWFWFDLTAEWRSRQGDILGPSRSFLTLPYIASRLLAANTPENPWYDHDRQIYRLMFSEYCAASTDGLTYRFNFLEHTDENSWQVNFGPGRGFDTNLLQLLVPPPADRTPIEEALPVATIRPRANQVLVPQNDGADVGGGDWSVTPPAVSQTQRSYRIRSR